MTLREVQALILLYQACESETVRQRCLALVPDLAEWDDVIPTATTAKRYRLTLRDASGTPAAEAEVVCRSVDLPAHVDDLRARFPLVVGGGVRAEEIVG